MSHRFKFIRIICDFNQAKSRNKSHYMTALPEPNERLADQFVQSTIAHNSTSM